MVATELLKFKMLAREGKEVSKTPYSMHFSLWEFYRAGGCSPGHIDCPTDRLGSSLPGVS